MNPSLANLSQLSANELVGLLRAELKQHWHSGKPTRVEDLVASVPANLLNQEGLLDLIYQEIVVREELGEKPTLDEYRSRFPNLEPLLRRQFELHELLRQGGLASNNGEATATVQDHGLPIQTKSFPMGGLVGPYRIEEELGRGGMGIVFKARDPRLQRSVALKLVRGQELATPELLQRFRTEAEILAQLQHPNIVQIFEIGEQDSTLFLAMELVEGKTLQDKVRENPLDAKNAARMVQTLAQAMQTAHERGIIHRDLKPSNVLLSQDQTPKVTDFGLARHGKSDMTAPGDVMGTPSYMAPEQALGEIDRIDPTTDVYALGAILYELLTGRAPFRGASVAATLDQVLRSDPPRPSRLQPGVPIDLETICLKCLQKNQSKRYASAKDLADDLDRFLRGEPILARRVGALEGLVKWARREPKVAGLSGVVILVTLIGFAATLYLWQSERRERQNTQEQLYFNAIQLAERELAADKVPWAEKALARCPESLRDWEWRHLMYRCKNGEPKPLAMPAPIVSLTAHSQHNTIVVGCSNGKIAIYEGVQPARDVFSAHRGSVNWLTLSHDGTEFVSGGEDRQIHLWKIATGERTATFAEHQAPISCVAYHPTEPWIASATFGGAEVGEIFVWNRNTQERLHTLKKHSKTVTSLVFDPQGTLLASASHDHTIMLWNSRTGAIVRELREHRMPVAAVAFSPDGKYLASSAGRTESDRPEEDEVFLWESATGKLIHRLHGHRQRVVALAFLPTGKRLASAGWDHQVKLWDIHSGQEALTLSGHTAAIFSIAFDQRGWLYTGSLDRTVRVWKQ